MLTLGTFSSSQIQLQIGVNRKTVNRFIRRLRDAGYLELVEDRPGKPDGVLYQIKKGGPVNLPKTIKRRENARERAWTSMRILKTFTLAQLEATAEIGRVNLNQYVQALQRRGYLRIACERQKGYAGSWNHYRLIRNSGPLAPLARRDGTIFDPNTNQYFGEKTNERA